ncbi:MAG TPA: cell division protein FtsL [Bacilli bacterium]|nr:cell division protein FtsL [Bacilli bacterium]
MSMYRDNLARNLPQKQESAQRQTSTSTHVQPRTEQSKAAAREKLKWLGTILVCIVIALTLVGRYAHMVSMNYQIQEQKDQLQAINDEKLRLEQEMLELSSAERIKNVAANQLGMKTVGQDQIVILQGSQGSAN